MKAVIGILVIFTGFFIEYNVFTGKIAQGTLQPPATSSTAGLPTTTNTSSSFSATTGQGSTSGTYGTYQPPTAGGYKVS